MKVGKIFVVIMTLFALLATSMTSFAARNDRATLVAKFDAMDGAINKGEGYSKSTNESGGLAWGESYLLEAYLDMYEATGNQKYLISFVRHADRVVANTDKNRHIADYKGHSEVAWSSTKYSLKGERVVWLVHSGMITYPLARFAFLVKRDNLRNYRFQAGKYAAVAKAALAVFEGNWCNDQKTGCGYYNFSTDDPIAANTFGRPMPLPYNQQLAAGRTFIMLYQVSGDEFYRQRAEALARHFRNNLIIKDGVYTWYYWYGKGLNHSTAFEDLSHGAIDIDFAILAERSGIVFTRADMNGFLEMYKKNLLRAGTIADHVNGSGQNTYVDAAGRWLELAEFSSVPWNHVRGLISRGALHPEVMLGVAKLVKYYDRGNS